MPNSKGIPTSVLTWNWQHPDRSHGGAAFQPTVLAQQHSVSGSVCVITLRFYCLLLLWFYKTLMRCYQRFSSPTPNKTASTIEHSGCGVKKISNFRLSLSLWAVRKRRNEINQPIRNTRNISSYWANIVSKGRSAIRVGFFRLCSLSKFEPPLKSLSLLFTFPVSMFLSHSTHYNWK